jgi:hypothetical protein
LTITVATHPRLKLGRTPKILRPFLNFNQIKQLYGFKMTAPVTFDYTTGLPADTGMMGNSDIGDCTAAAKYHRWQATNLFATGNFVPGDILTPLAEALYAATTGWDPNAALVDGQNPTDQGGNMETIADALVTSGMPLPGGEVEHFTAAFEVDTTNVIDMSHVGQICYGLDLGIQVTTSVMPADGSAPPPVWDVSPSDTPLGGHDIFCLGRLASGNWAVVSWGKLYQLTPAFMHANCNTALGYVAPDALKDGKTVLNMDAPTWDNAVAAYGVAA